ncbi:MAG: hypothetical protein Q9N26_05230 [Aquificota bacterium]|nr:hypothetical protein [Aquificota bacterium]
MKVLRITSLYILLGLFLVVLSLIQRSAGFGNYTETVVYFAIPSVITGTVFQMYPVLQGIEVRFRPLIYLHAVFFLTSLGFFLAGLPFEAVYFLCVLVFTAYLLLNSRVRGGQIRLFLVVGSLFYLAGSYMLTMGFGNPFLVLHTFTVGFMITVAMGSMYLLIPMLQVERVAFGRYLWVHLVFHTFFVVDLLISWHTLSWDHIYVSGILVLASVLFLCLVLFMTLSRREGPRRGLDPTVRYMILALFILVFSLTVGILSAGAKDFSLIRVHTDTALYGFFVLITVGASLHIIPSINFWIRGGGPDTEKRVIEEKVSDRVMVVLTGSLVGMVISGNLREVFTHTFELIYALGVLYYMKHAADLTFRT